MSSPRLRVAGRLQSLTGSSRADRRAQRDKEKARNRQKKDKARLEKDREKNRLRSVHAARIPHSVSRVISTWLSTAACKWRAENTGPLAQVRDAKVERGWTV